MTAAQRGRGVALARAALAGNPSDGYGGAVLAVTLEAWSAQAQADPSTELFVEPSSSLVRATVDRFAGELEPAASATAVRWSTLIPAGVGLGGSSALVIATTRALCELYGAKLGEERLASFALAVETEDLGIVAGLQDRVTQAFGGLVFMDFADRGSKGSGEPARHGLYEQLRRELLPPLLIAWRADAGGHSGEVHASLRERHRRGEEVVHLTIGELARAAREARAALLTGDVKRFCGCVDQSFDLRRRMLDLDGRCVEMIETARASGASANYTGSGGAIVAVCPQPRRLATVEQALRCTGCDVRQYP